jgi:hypothetical protein
VSEYVRRVRPRDHELPPGTCDRRPQHLSDRPRPRLPSRADEPHSKAGDLGSVVGFHAVKCRRTPVVAQPIPSVPGSAASRSRPG